MNIVNELNELAEKMTGINPQCTTDAEAVDYIEQNYKGGSAETYTLDATFNTYFADPSKYGEEIVIENEGHINIINKIKETIEKNPNTIIKVGVTGQNGYINYYYPIVTIKDGELTEIVMEMVGFGRIVEADILLGSEFHSIIPNIYTIS